eukprot:7973-Heterococcus_DN1.PRE.7
MLQVKPAAQKQHTVCAYTATAVIVRGVAVFCVPSSCQCLHLDHALVSGVHYTAACQALQLYCCVTHSGVLHSSSCISACRVRTLLCAHVLSAPCRSCYQASPVPILMHLSQYQQSIKRLTLTTVAPQVHEFCTRCRSSHRKLGCTDALAAAQHMTCIACFKLSATGA